MIKLYSLKWFMTKTSSAMLSLELSTANVTYIGIIIALKMATLMQIIFTIRSKSILKLFMLSD